MSKILTGIQSTGTPHLGNILGAIIPAIKMANESNEESYLFIANMHSLTQIKDKKTLNDNTFATAATCTLKHAIVYNDGGQIHGDRTIGLGISSPLFLSKTKIKVKHATMQLQQPKKQNHQTVKIKT